MIKSSNLGDNRTLAIPVAHTIYYEMGAERRASMGIADSLIRISVGIEDTDDLIDDFDKALDAEFRNELGMTGRIDVPLERQVAMITGGAGGIGRAAGSIVRRGRRKRLLVDLSRMPRRKYCGKTSAAIA